MTTPLLPEPGLSEHGASQSHARASVSQELGASSVTTSCMAALSTVKVTDK